MAEVICWITQPFLGSSRITGYAEVIPVNSTAYYFRIVGKPEVTGVSSG
jgi:hypothetical protein